MSASTSKLGVKKVLQTGEEKQQDPEESPKATLLVQQQEQAQ